MDNMKILDNRTMKIIFVAIVAMALNIATFIFADFNVKGGLILQYVVEANKADAFQLFYSNGEEWNEEHSIYIDYNIPGEKQTLSYNLPEDVQRVRMDLGNKEGCVLLSNISINYLWKTLDISNKILTDNVQSFNVDSIKQEDGYISIERTGTDPYIVVDLMSPDIDKLLSIDDYMNYIFKIMVCGGINILLLIFIKKRSTVKILIEEIYRNKPLIWNLAKNDFKTKYAGSYLGIIWAFIQPIVTVLVYWFVFQVGFKSAPVQDFPFVLWLVSGLVPWFFFSEALLNATNSMLEYSYLVKKVVFKISVLPIVKIISALFVHIFFIAFTIVLFALNGYMPNIYTLQVVYYTCCMFIFVLGISYATCAIIIFFKDLSQIIGIILQVGTWMTPIMWSYSMVPEKYQWILKINPMYYIVEGYRDSLINRVWFWERFNQSIYFWTITFVLFAVGAIIFKRLKPHFSDVL